MEAMSAAGVGKTTIAHVVAKHCGYQTVEINASDDRSATALQSRIQDAVQMQSVIGRKKPNLVVIDEVDGVAGKSHCREYCVTQCSGSCTQLAHIKALWVILQVAQRGRVQHKCC